MTTAEAIALANHVKPTTRRASLDKLQGSANTVADLSTDVIALRKSYDVIGKDVSGIAAQLSKIVADVEYLTNLTPGSPVRRMHS